MIIYPFLVLIFATISYPIELEKEVRKRMQLFLYYQYVQESLDSNGYFVNNDPYWEDKLLNDKCQFNMELEKEENLSFPDGEYTLYKIVSNTSKINCNGKVYWKTSIHNPSTKDQLGLVGYRIKDGNILYLSGYFFEEKISRYFRDDKGFNEINYLKFKLYKYRPWNLVFLSRDGPLVTYRAYSQTHNSFILVTFNLNLPDILNIEYENK